VNISSHEEYGLRCAVRLAESFGSGPVAASKIAEKEGISVEYASKFMHLFRKAGFVTSVRGTQGGFELAKAPGELTLQEILLALDSKGIAAEDFCSQFSGQKEVCANFGNCSVRPLWSIITDCFETFFQKLYLADLMKSESAVKKRVAEILLEEVINTNILQSSAMNQ